MKKLNIRSDMAPGLSILGLIMLFVIVMLAWAGIAGDGGSTSSPGAKATNSPSRASSPAASPTTKPSPSPTSSSESRLKLLVVNYACRADAASPVERFYTMEDAWAAAPMEECVAARIDPDSYDPDTESWDEDTDPPSEFQLAALTTAYGTDHDLESLNNLYAICAQTAGIPIDAVVGAAQTAELEGAFLLCPKHPKAATIQANIAAGKEFRAAQAEIDKATAEGRLAPEGSYLVGPDVQPGTWQSVGEKVENCYWEVSDAQGDIIANNFINIAPQFTIEIPANASGFTVRGCSFKLISPQLQEPKNWVDRPGVFSDSGACPQEHVNHV